jgi:hypothetical protein
MTYEYTSLGITEATAEELWEDIGEQRAQQAVEMVAARQASTPNRWLIIGLGIGAGWLIGRWLKRRDWQQNPMPWSLEKVSKSGLLGVFDERTGETLGYVLPMKGYFAALTQKQAVIGDMPTAAAAAGLVYGRFYEKFAGADTLFDVPAPNPEYEFSPMLPGMMAVLHHRTNIGYVNEQEDGSWEAQVGGGVPKKGFATPEDAAEHLLDVHMPRERAKRREETKKRVKELAKQEEKEELIRVDDAELDNRIIITLYRSKTKGKSYKKAPSGVERGEAKQLLLPKKMTPAEIAKKVKAPERRVTARCRALARAKKIYGHCGYRKVDIPTTKVDPKGRKVMTFKKARRMRCWFAAFGPAGELGLFARGEHKLPEENPAAASLEFEGVHVVRDESGRAVGTIEEVSTSTGTQYLATSFDGTLSERFSNLYMAEERLRLYGLEHYKSWGKYMLPLNIEIDGRDVEIGRRYAWRGRTTVPQWNVYVDVPSGLALRGSTWDTPVLMSDSVREARNAFNAGAIILFTGGSDKGLWSAAPPSAIRPLGSIPSKAFKGLPRFVTPFQAVQWLVRHGEKPKPWAELPRDLKIVEITKGKEYAFYLGDMLVGGAIPHLETRKMDPRHVGISDARWFAPWFVSKKNERQFITRRFASAKGFRGRAMAFRTVYADAPSVDEAADMALSHWERKGKKRNPSQPVLEFGEKQYEVRERKPIARSTGGRMRYTKWTRVGRYDTLTAAKRATRMWHPPQTRREFRKQRAIFLDNKRVSDGDRLLPKYRDLPEQP